VDQTPFSASQPNNKIGDDIVNPEERAGLFSLLTFSWMNPLLAAGYKAPLIEEDVWKIGKRDTSMVRCMRQQAAALVHTPVWCCSGE
jgi:hypothetical protein